MDCMLKQAGLNVVVASASGNPIVGGAATLQAGFKTVRCQNRRLCRLYFSMHGCGNWARIQPMTPESLEIVKKAVAQGKPVAAQDSAVLILARAGVLDGKQFATGADKQQYILKGIYKGTEVVQDGNIITSGELPLPG